jgi:hypothetical protein
MLTRQRALALLLTCDGDELWDEQYCREQGIPELWIEQLVDNFESGFRSVRQTIFFEGRLVNQYRGVRAVDLAVKLGEYLGADVKRATATALSRTAIVKAIREAVDEL